MSISKRTLPWLLAAPLALAAAPASADCKLGTAQKPLQHVVYVTFDNTHLARDNARVPSDLEQMPHLLERLRGKGTVLANHHTPLISHTSVDLITALTGVYGDRHGVPIGNSFRYYTPSGDSDSAGSFTYWTDPLDPTGKVETLPEMLGPDGKAAPAPWAPYTKAGCDVGAAGSANIVLENATSDITTVFGAGSTQAAEAKSDSAQASADFVGIAVHCAQGSALCSAANGGRPDALPGEPGGYSGYNGLFGHKYVAPVLSSAPLVALDGKVIADSSGRVGFPGFDGMSAAVSLAYVASMLERGLPVAYAYVSDAHDNHVTDDAFGPGQAGYVQQLAAYDAAFDAFFTRLERAGIDESNTLFVFTADEGDHFVGGAPSPANCDGVHTPCSYANIGELDTNLTGLLNAAGNTASWKVHSDSAPNLWVAGNPAPDSTVARDLGRTLTQLTVTNPLTGKNEKLANYVADPTEMRLLHMISADPLRTPTFTMFAKTDYYVENGASGCGATCVVEAPAFAWNHGDVGSDINVTWLGMMGPGVGRNGIDARVWSDHTDVRPTMMALAGLRDVYVHQGRVLSEVLEPSAQPHAWAHHGAALLALARAYKQLNAPVGTLGLASLRISTRSIASGSDGKDEVFAQLTGYLKDVADRRDRLATQMEALLDGATFAGNSVDEAEARRLTQAAQELTAEVGGVAAFIGMLP